MKLIRVGLCLTLLLATATAAFAQSPAPLKELYAAGVSYNPGATPQIAGSFLYSHEIGSTETYGFTAVDELPNSSKPFTVMSNIAVGIAQKVATIDGVHVIVPTAAGVSLSGSNAGWAWSAGAAALIPLKKDNFYLMPTVRAVKSSVAGATGIQPIVGILLAWGK